MRRKLTVLILTLAAMMACAVCAQAADAANQVKNVDVESGYELTLLDQNGGEVTPSSGAYSGVAKLGLSFDGDEGKEYVVFLLSGDSSVPSADNIRYIDQKTGTDEMEFLLYPDQMTKSGHYAVYVSSSDGYCAVAGMDVVSLLPVITSQPKDVTTAVGGKAVFSVTATGATGYQWQFKAPGGTWKNNSCTTATFTLDDVNSGGIDRNGYQYRCVVKNAAGSVTSNAATLTVSAVVLPTITTQPKSQTVAAGGTATFTVEATGAESYQWRYRTANGTTWYNATATGNKTATLKVPVTEAKDGYVYCCRVTNAAGTTVSQWATLTVKKEATKPVITTQPKSQTVAAGGTATFTVKATGEDLTYQWRYRTATGTTWNNATATGNKTATLKVPVTASKDGYIYCCRVTNAAGTVVSSWATLTVQKEAAKPVITTQPTDVTVAPTAKASFTVAATGAESYQWQYRTSSTGTWANATATGNKTATLSMSPANASRDGYQYRCKITNASGTVYSNVVTLYIKPAITAQPQSVEANAGGTAKFTVTANGKDVTYQWQYRTSSSGSWAKATATGNQTDTLSVPATAGRNGYQYRCVVTGKSGKITYSNAATLTVK